MNKHGRISFFGRRQILHMDRDPMAWMDALDNVFVRWRWFCGVGAVKRVQDTVALVLIAAGGSRCNNYNGTGICNRVYSKPLAGLGGMGLFGFAI